MTELSKSQNVGFLVIFFIALIMGVIIGYELGERSVLNKLDEYGYTLYDNGMMGVEIAGDRYYSIESDVSTRGMPETGCGLSTGCWLDKETRTIWIEISDFTNKTSTTYKILYNDSKQSDTKTEDAE